MQVPPRQGLARNALPRQRRHVAKTFVPQWVQKTESAIMEAETGFLGLRRKSKSMRMVGGSLARRIKAGSWYPYKMDLPSLPPDSMGCDWDFAVNFPSPTEPERCYPWAQSRLERDAGMDTHEASERLPALWRVHTADVLVHEIDERGVEVALCEDQEGIDEEVAGAPDGTPAGAGAVNFVLYKEGLRTSQAVFFLARALDVPLGAFTWAVGMDAKAATSQRVSIALVDGISAREVLSALRRIGPHKKFERGRLRVGGFSLSEHPVRPGQSRGRRVFALLRNVRGTAQEIQTRLSNLAEVGAPNFFGVERFGMTQGPRPHDVAVELANGRWRGALEKVLEMEAWLNPGVRAVHDQMGTTDQVHQGMLAKIPPHLPHVRALLGGLIRTRSFREAYLSVGSAMRAMWEGALPSLLWNKLASARLNLHPHRVIVGDVVWRRGEEPRLIGTEEEAEKCSLFDVVMPLVGTGLVDEPNTLWPMMGGCDFNSFVSELAALGVPYPPAFPPDLAVIPARYRPLMMRPYRLDWRIFEEEMVNTRVLATDPHASQIGCEIGEPVECGEKRLAKTHALRTKGLGGMMYTFDWDCESCGTHNVFLRNKCSECGAAKALSMPDEELLRQRGINGDLRNCTSVWVSCGLPHGSNPSVVLRTAFELHLWRFYPNGYFYQDVLQPILRFHLDKGRVALPPTREEVQTDRWLVDPDQDSWHDSSLPQAYPVPEETIDEWFRDNAWEHFRSDQALQYTSLAGAWKYEGEAWQNIILDPLPTDRQKMKYVTDRNTGGVIRVSKRQRDLMTRSVPPKVIGLPVVPLPAAVRNSRRTTGYFTSR
eukprot:Hpha_TRINITY_DN30522_c0_g1::TRINITY_DN30522_c0_g1_i1::g.193747::m.193747/K06176/truD, PUS7; tRNA pseudouridine13 synthase